MSMISEGTRKAVSYIEKLRGAFENPQPFYSPEEVKKRINGKKGIPGDFPRDPGVYIILRQNPLSKNPVVLYVGSTTREGGVRSRLGDHFSKIDPSRAVGGSQFTKFLMQVVQNEDTVRDILWKDVNTVIAAVGMPGESKEMIELVEKLAIQVFKPRFNVDR